MEFSQIKSLQLGEKQVKKEYVIIDFLKKTFTKKLIEILF